MSQGLPPSLRSVAEENCRRFVLVVPNLSLATKKCVHFLGGSTLGVLLLRCITSAKVMHMATTKPRITITLTAEDHQVLQRLSSLSGESMSRIVSGLVTSVSPALSRVADVISASQNALPETLEQLRDISDRGERVMSPLLAAGVEAFDQITSEIVAAGEGSDPRRCNNGGRIS